MLPFGLPWYRRLIGAAVVLGIAGGVFGLVYLGATGEIIDWFFGDAGTGWWSGEWWWIPLIASGGLVVAILRRAWGCRTRYLGELRSSNLPTLITEPRPSGR